MDNRRAVIWSLLAALIAVIAFWLYVEKAVDQKIGSLKEREIILVARETIPPGTRINEMHFVEQDYPSAFASKSAARSRSEVLGQETLVMIQAGDPILTTNLIPYDETSLDRRIPEGFRAVTVGIRDDQDVIGVGGMIRPGHFVDILLTLFVNSEEFEKGVNKALAAVEGEAQLRAETRTIFQNIRILAVGQDTRLKTLNVKREFQVNDLANKNVTVALRPDDVQKLVLAQATGRMTLSLRRFNDTKMEKLDHTDPFRAFGIKLPVVAGPQPAYREIRGGDVTLAPF